MQTKFAWEPELALENNNLQPDVRQDKLSDAPDARHLERTREDDNTTPAPIRSDRERIIGETEYIMMTDDMLGALDPRRSINRRDSSDWENVEAVDSSEGVPEISVFNPSTFDHLDHRTGVHRAAAYNNQDGELHVPSLGRPPMGHSLSEPVRFDNINHSAISIGGGKIDHSTTSFSGGTHYHNPSERIRPGLELLQKRVAPSAFHNSAQRVDPPRCHPDTRVAIQKQIYDWIVMGLIRRMWIMWIHGAAGAGKSAIMQSIAEFCEKEQIPLASFFFFRTDPTRNSMAPFIATLVYQLIQSIPQVQDEILGIIESNPLVFEQSLKSQFDILIIQPLLRLQTHFQCYFVVMIDGLDECIDRAHQADLIQSLGSISRSRATPVIFLVASRREPQIEATFISKQISNLVLTLPLDNSDIEETSDDIRRFLVDKFCNIKETHLFKHHLPIDWPPSSSVDEIVSKSSGQFIFASVVISYLSSPRANPARQLEVIRGIRIRDPSSKNPFAHLDALYEYIFSQVDALDKVLDIIAFDMASGQGPSSTVYIQNIFLLEDGELDILFADLTSVILWTPPGPPYAPQLKFLHASLPDYLLDKSRSEQYHIDVGEYRTNLLCRFLETRPPILDPLQLSYDDLRTAIEQESSRLSAIRYLLKKAKPSEKLHSAFMNFDYTFYSKTFFDRVDDRYDYNLSCYILKDLKRLNFRDHGKASRHVVDIFAGKYSKHWPSLAVDGKKYAKKRSPVLAARIEQFQPLSKREATSYFSFKWCCPLF